MKPKKRRKSRVKMDRTPCSWIGRMRKNASVKRSDRRYHSSPKIDVINHRCCCGAVSLDRKKPLPAKYPISCRSSSPWHPSSCSCATSFQVSRASFGTTPQTQARCSLPIFWMTWTSVCMTASGLLGLQSTHALEVTGYVQV